MQFCLVVDIEVTYELGKNTKWLWHLGPWHLPADAQGAPRPRDGHYFSEDGESGEGVEAPRGDEGLDASRGGEGGDEGLDATHGGDGGDEGLDSPCGGESGSQQRFGGWRCPA